MKECRNEGKKGPRKRCWKKERKEGRKEGKQERRKEGRKEGRKEERKEGTKQARAMKEGRKEGREKGRKEGRKEIPFHSVSFRSISFHSLPSPYSINKTITLKTENNTGPIGEPIGNAGPKRQAPAKTSLRPKPGQLLTTVSIVRPEA